MKRLFTTLTVFCAFAAAQAPENVFQIKAGPSVSGTERFSIADPKEGEGYVLTCKATFTVPGSSSETQQTFTLNPRWEPVRYKFETDSGGLKQVIEAWEEKGKFKLKGSGGGKGTEATVPGQARTILVDNLVACHLQALLNRIALHRPDEELSRDTAWSMLVPQALIAVSARIFPDGELDGSLNDKPIHLKRFRLLAAGVSEEILAEATSLALERVSISAQNLEMTREGFHVGRPSGNPDASERNLTFPSADFAIPATLCVPRGKAGPFPVLVLVSGSGPHDRDETVGPNKTFRDIAWGLAARGIATLRYETRSFAFKKEFASQQMTLEAEVLDDAVAALDFAGKQKEVDPKRVFLAGHGLGGELAPPIAARSRSIPGVNLAGVILLAASARPLDEMVLEETTAQVKLAGLNEDPPQIKKLRDDLGKMRSGELAGTEMIAGLPVSYWREFRSLQALDVLKNLTVPVLVLQGGKDVRVHKADYDALMQALSAKPPEMQEGNLFLDLNHLFQMVVGESTGAEYAKPVPVAPSVIEAMAEWIKKQKQ